MEGEAWEVDMQWCLRRDRSTLFKEGLKKSNKVERIRKVRCVEKIGGYMGTAQTMLINAWRSLSQEHSPQGKLSTITWSEGLSVCLSALPPQCWYNRPRSRVTMIARMEVMRGSHSLTPYYPNRPSSFHYWWPSLLAAKTRQLLVIHWLYWTCSTRGSNNLSSWNLCVLCSVV